MLRPAEEPSTPCRSSSCRTLYPASDTSRAIPLLSLTWSFSAASVFPSYLEGHFSWPPFSRHVLLLLCLLPPTHLGRTLPISGSQCLPPHGTPYFAAMGGSMSPAPLHPGSTLLALWLLPLGNPSPPTYPPSMSPLDRPFSFPISSDGAPLTWTPLHTVLLHSPEHSSPLLSSTPPTPSCELDLRPLLSILLLTSLYPFLSPEELYVPSGHLDLGSSERVACDPLSPIGK